MFRHILIKILLCAIAFPPANLAFVNKVMAAGVVPDAAAPARNRPGTDVAPSGVPVVNIVAPNASGLSHNKYADFNVGTPGLILNNSKAHGVASQLGGPLVGNPNLQKAQEASAILNEVTSSNRSRIDGHMEVHGRKADVILANPNGITVNGGGFINVSRATLTTGHPHMDAAGNLQSFEVKNGDVRIEGKGLNASDTDAFDIITRAAAINGKLYANNLNVVTGGNSYNPSTGTATPLAPDGAKPVVSIDSRELGGMYAGRIRLVSTEKGVGVNLQGIVQANTDLTISADGGLSAKNLAANGNISIAAPQVDRIGSALAGGDISITAAGKNVLSEQVIANGSVALSGKTIEADKATIGAGKDLLLLAADELFLNASDITALNAKIQSGAFRLNGSRFNVLDSGQCNVTSLTQDKSSIFFGGAGNIFAGGLGLGAGSSLLSGGDLSIAADAITNAGGMISAESNLLLQGAVIHNKAGGNILAGKNLVVQGKNGGSAAQALNESSTIGSGDGDVVIAADAITNAGGLISAKINLLLQGAVIHNKAAGDILAGKNLAVQGKNGGSAAQALNESSTIGSGDGDVVIAADAITNAGGMLSAGSGLLLQGAVIHNKGNGNILAGNDITLQGKNGDSSAQALNEASTIRSADGDVVIAANAITNAGGMISAGSNLLLRGAVIHNKGNGNILAGNDITLQDKNGGSAARALNEASTIRSADGDVTITADAITNAGGLMFAGDDLLLQGAVIHNKDSGDILAGNDITLQGKNGGSAALARNEASTIESLNGSVTIQADNLENVALVDGTVSREYGDTEFTALGVSNWTYTVTDAYGVPHEYTRRVFEYKRDETDARVTEINELYGIPTIRYYDFYHDMEEWITPSWDVFTGTITPAGIYASRDINFSGGGLLNDNSTISAGKNINIKADRLHNTGLELNYYVTIDRTYYWVSCRYHEGEDAFYGDHDHRYRGTYRETGTQGSRAAGSYPAIISAAGTIYADVRQGLDNGSVSSGQAYAGSGAAFTTPQTPQTPQTPRTPPAMRTPQMAQTDEIPPIRLGGLFRYAPPGQSYVIASGLDMGNFLGSSYFLARLGMDMDKLNTRLLGDAFFETRYVRDQVLSRTGRRYLYPDSTDDADMMRMLFDNAVKEGDALHLSVGTALTPEQVAGLTSDIIWLEEKTYMGQKVLVPTLYLCDATKNDSSLPRGATISADTIVATAGSINNSGAIRANDAAVLSSATDVVNRAGDIYGGKILSVDAARDLVNQSGVLSGGDISLTAGRDVRMETIIQSDGAGMRVGSRAEVKAGGDLVISAGNDAAFTGAAVTAGGTAAISAGNDIRIEAAQGSGGNGKNFETERRWVGRDKSGDLRATGLSGSTLRADQLALRAGHDVNIVASGLHVADQADIAAGNDVNVLAGTSGSELRGKGYSASYGRRNGSGLDAGSLSMDAGRDINVAASAIGTNDDLSMRAKNSITVSSALETTAQYRKESGFLRETTSNKNVASTITAGGSVFMDAGSSPQDGTAGNGNITVIGSAVTAGEDVGLQAGGDVIIASAQDSGSYYCRMQSRGFFSSRTSLDESAYTRQVGSAISGDNVLISASTVAANNDLGLKADRGDVMILAGQDTEWSHSESKKSGFNFGNIILTGLTGGLNTFFSNTGAFYSATAERSRNTRATSAPSFISAGRNLTVSAGRDAGVIGSHVSAGNDLNVAAARDVNILPGRESFTSEYRKSTTQAGIWGSLGASGLSLFAGMKSATRGVDRAGDYTAGSSLSAGRDVTIAAGRDVNQTGSRIVAGRDAIIDAGRDWNMLAGYDHESLHQYVKTVEAGVTASISQSVTPAANGFIKLPQTALTGKGYSAMTAAGAGLRAVNAADGAVSRPVSASATIGASYTRNASTSSTSTARPSSVTAGRSVAATTGRDITIEGGTMAGKQDVLLNAGRDLNILTAKSDSSAHSSSESGGGGVGLKAVIDGEKGVAFGVNASAEAAGSNGKNASTSYRNAQIMAGDTLITRSGRDTTVAGAHLEGDKVRMDVGRNLTVASVQDTADSKSSSWNASVDVTVGYGMNVSGKLGLGKSRTDSDWVGEQTIIKGRKEVGIYVEKNTHLKGAILATEPGGDLTLNTGSLTYEEIRDKNKGENWNADISHGFTVGNVGLDEPGKGMDFWTPKPHTYNATVSSDPKSYLPNSVALQYGSHDKEGVLRPTVTEGVIIVRNDPNTDLGGLNRDINRARQTTKDENVSVDVNIPVHTIIDQARKNAENNKKEDISEQVVTMLKDKVKNIGKKLEAYGEAIRTLMP
jgi:filamentous hemagglutinin